MGSNHHSTVEFAITLVEVTTSDFFPVLILALFLVSIAIINMKQDIHMRTKSPEKLSDKISRLTNRESLIKKYQRNERDIEQENAVNMSHRGGRQ